MKKIIKTDEEWKELLNENEFLVTRKKGTEPPFQVNHLIQISMVTLNVFAVIPFYLKVIQSLNQDPVGQVFLNHIYRNLLKN